MILSRLAPPIAAFALLLSGFLAPALAQSERQVAQGTSPLVYQVESAPNGDGTGDPELFLDTPMGLIESFMMAGEREDWRGASHALDFTNIERRGTQASREELAAQLYHLMNHTVAIDWAQLPDRPDAMDTDASSKNPMAGVARRSLSIAMLELGNRRVPIRLARVQAPGGEPVWVFSRQTVDNVPALYRKYGPTGFEEMLPATLRQPAAWTLAWWELIALPLLLIVAALAGLGTYVAIRRWREHYDTDTKLGGVLQAIHLPVTLLAFAGTFALVRNSVLRLSGPAKDLLDPFQLILVIGAILGIALAAIEAMFELATNRRTDELEAPGNHEDRNFYTKLSAIRRIVTALLLLAAVGFLLVASNIADTLGFSILASAGAMGLVLAFAARKVLGDIMASVQIAFAQTARIGDAVQFEGQWCFVEKIGFTHLRLRTWDERRVIAPVSTFTGESFENWTKQDASLMTHVELELDNRADVDALREEFLQFAQQDEDVIDPEDAVCEVVGQHARAKTVRFMARASDPKTGWSMHCRMREHMLAYAARLDATAEPMPAYFSREREISIGSHQGS